MKEFFDKIVAYFQDNPIYFYIAIAIAALIVIAIIVIIVAGVKRSKAKKSAAARNTAVPAARPNQQQFEDQAAAKNISAAVHTEESAPAGSRMLRSSHGMPQSTPGKAAARSTAAGSS